MQILTKRQAYRNTVDDLGILNDGTGSDQGMLSMAFIDGNYIFLPTGIYNIDTMLSLIATILLCAVYMVELLYHQQTLTNFLRL